MITHFFNASTGEAEVGESKSLRPVFQDNQSYRETLSKQTKNK